MRRLAVPAVLGAAHGVADGAAGLLLGSLLFSLELTKAGVLVLLYNVLAFGVQPAVGMLVDRSRRPKSAAVLGLILLCVGLIALGLRPELAVMLSGLGSALFHVGGGALAVRATRNSAAGAGFFAAPGVLGLAIGGALAATNHIVIWPFAATLLLSCVGVIALRMPASPVSLNTNSGDEPISSDLGVVVLLLLAAIAVRSAVWSGLQLVFQGQIKTIILLAVAACAGKLLGGFLADWIGWRRWATGALLTAVPFLILGEWRAQALLVGVALLQSATPVTLAATAKLLPRQPATAAGLALGLAIAAGGLPVYGGLATAIIAPPVLTLMIAVAALSFWRVLSSAGENRLARV